MSNNSTNNNSDNLTEEEINFIRENGFKNLAEGQQEYYSRQIENGKGKKSNKKDNNNSIIITSQKEIERNRILNEIQKLRQENSELTFEEWSNILYKKYQQLKAKVDEYFPEISLELDFVLSIKAILNIEDITLPFMGIVLAAPSSMKTKVIELLRKWIYSYFTDKFTAKSFVSHSATVTKEKLSEVDMLPRIKDKILLTPELSPLFTGKEEDIKEQFGVITRILDGDGFESESGVHGQRGYYGNYMFTWLGAAVDIPYSVYKFLSTIGFKIYFLRLPRTEITTDDLVDQIIAEKLFSEKIREIEKLLLDYLNWFEICPLSIGLQNLAKIEWNKTKDDRNTIKTIAELAQLLAHLRGTVLVYKSSEYPDLIPVESTNNNNNSTTTTTTNTTTTNYHTESFSHRLPIIENPSRAVQQLYNLARGHALSQGRNYITEEDISLVVKVVLSTSSIERVLILDLLIGNKGNLTTSQITSSMRISPDTAKRTMTEFKGLELVTMERTNIEKSNSEYKITLNPKFEWFLKEEFTKVREGFKPTDNRDLAKRKNTLVSEEEKTQQKEDQQEKSTESTTTNTENNTDLHRGKSS